MTILQNTMPTLLVSGKKYVSLKELKLESVCALKFSFDKDGLRQHWDNHVSDLELMRHYCCALLPQFKRRHFLFI